MNFPQYLYCYFSIEKGIQFLESLKFRLSAISDFNDPFESLFRTEYPYLFLSYDENCDDSVIQNRIETLDKYKFPNTYLVSNKSKGLVNIMKSIRIGCLSETFDNVLMWGHYCRKFTGLVIKFRGSLTDWGNDLRQVEYTDSRISISTFDSSAVGAVSEERRLLTLKSKLWEYEKEWRYVKLTKDCEKDKYGYYKQMDKESIVEVIIGCRVCPKDLIKIKDIIKKKFGDKIPIKVILPATSSFSLETWDLAQVEFALQWNKIREKNTFNRK